MKKIISIFLSITIILYILTIAPSTVLAAKASPNKIVGVSSGSTGNITWSIDDDNTLTISGSGKMEDYGVTYFNGFFATSAPWGDKYFKSTIHNLSPNLID